MRTNVLLIAILLAAVVVFIALPASSAQDAGKSPKRYLTEKTGEADLKKFAESGCEVVRNYGKVASLRCSEDAATELGLTQDLTAYAMDTGSNRQIGADAVWGMGYTGSGSTVAVLDTGIDYNHPELNDSYLGGWNFVSNSFDTKDDNGHGTHVSGIITANDGDAKGVAPGAKILALKVLDASGSGSFSSVIAAIYYAVDGPDGKYGTGDEFGVDVISMSLGTSSPYIYTGENCDGAFVELANAINYANSRGVAVVAASGNYNIYGQSGVSIPGCMSGAIGVGAVNGSDAIPWWSGAGSSLDIVAPGVGIYSTLPGNSYDSYSGTSMATPHVSGVIALMKQARRSLSVDETRNVLFTSAKDLGSSGFDKYNGWGRVNASASVGYARNFDTIPKMRIQGITITLQKDKTRGTRAIAVITVVDATGSHVQGASVSVRWNGITSDADWAVTDNNGQVTVYSDWKRNAKGTFTATVTNVIKSGMLFNASAGAVTGSMKV